MTFSTKIKQSKQGMYSGNSGQVDEMGNGQNLDSEKS